jgi:hypothetical protein
MADSMVGSYVDDIGLERFEGSVTPVSAWRGKRLALFCFSSWARGRGQLPLWQELKSRLPIEAEVLGIAAEVEGKRWLRGYLKQAETRFPVLIDRKNVAGAAFGFKAGPNVVLIDEAGCLVYRRLYDASLRKTDCRNVVERYLLQGIRPEALAPDATYAPKPVAQEAFAEAVDLFLAGDLVRCRVPWKRSIDLDREHWISQEQMWVLDAPERFHPWIDVAWQNTQLAAEGRPVCACDEES